MYQIFTRNLLWAAMRISFLIILVLTTATLLLSAKEGNSQTLKDNYVEIRLGKISLEAALKELEKKVNVSFAYDRKLLDGFTIDPINFSNERADKVLGHLLKNKPLVYRELNGAVVINGVKEKAVRHPQPGTISGQINDSKTGEALIGATVTVKNATAHSISDVEGKYSLQLEPGSYHLEFSFVGYQTKLVQNVVVKDHELTSLNVAMDENISQLGEVVVSADYSKASVEGLLVKQKNSSSITDGISADQIRLTPDNNTAQVLRRVSGVTVQNDRFVTIRGLSDRYNNVLINGTNAPSTEPNRRNFSFDIVPSSLVDNVLVNKTASPELPGEFSGGMVMINTKDIPEKNFVNFTIGRGINSESSGKTMISTKRDKYAILGIVDKEKKWFGNGRLFQQEDYFRYIATQDQHRMDSIGGKIPNRWQFYRYPYAPMQNYQVSAGIVKQLENLGKAGFTAAITYRNEQLIESGTLGRIFNEGNTFISGRYKYNTSIGALLNGAYKSTRHQLAWKNLYNIRYSDQFDKQLGYDAGDSRTYYRTSDITLSNRLIQSRLEGEHLITRGGIKVDWNADITDLLREQPDGRFVMGGHPDRDSQSLDPDEYVSYNFNDSFTKYGGIYAARLEETKKGAGINVTLPMQVLGAKQTVKTGYVTSKRSADYDGTFLRVLGTPPSELIGLPYEKIVKPEFFASGVFTYKPSFVRDQRTGDKYEASQELEGIYGMLDLMFFKKLRLSGGMRYEDNQMEVATIFYNPSSGYAYDSVKTYSDYSWLPSVNIIFSPRKKFNVRASYSKTLARPDFVERSSYVYYDFAENQQVTGQQKLEITRISNYDFRLEYYFSPGEIVSASVFYKEFLKPVERFSYTQNGVNGIEYMNLHRATAQGMEFNFIKSLNFTGISSHWLSNLYVSGNLAILTGEIFSLEHTKTASGEDSTYVSSYKRPIQGLSPYSINGTFGYQSDKWGFNIAYNKFGRRIVNGGTFSNLVQYEVPRDVIDLQLNWFMMKKRLVARINVSDLLNQEFILYANTTKTGSELNDDPAGDEYNPDFDYLLYSVRKGTSYSFSLSYTF